MNVKKAKYAKMLLEDIADAQGVLTKIGDKPFHLHGTEGIPLTPDIREVIRNAIRDYKQAKEDELKAL